MGEYWGNIRQLPGAENDTTGGYNLKFCDRYWIVVEPASVEEARKGYTTYILMNRTGPEFHQTHWCLDGMNDDVKVYTSAEAITIAKELNALHGNETTRIYVMSMGDYWRERRIPPLPMKSKHSIQAQEAIDETLKIARTRVNKI